MTSDSWIAAEAEGFVRGLANELTRPHDNECLCCYVARMLAQFPCDGSHRHALRFRDLSAPRATALLDRLGRVGACCCACELFLNGYQPRWMPRQPVPDALDDEDDDDWLNDDEEDLEWGLESLPPCAGVRRGSVRPCGN